MSMEQSTTLKTALVLGPPASQFHALALIDNPGRIDTVAAEHSMDQWSIYKQIKYFMMDKGTKRLPVSQLHDYWKAPNDGDNAPEQYVRSGHERSQFLVELVDKYAHDKNVTILEPGCNVGRNLNHLYSAGYHNLAGIEISDNALSLMASTYPRMYSDVSVYRGSIEDMLPPLTDGQFDIVFTMAVLEHIHYESEWIFEHLVRITSSCLITIEDERGVSWRHFPRNYQTIFTRPGITQVECYENLPKLSAGFRARVFTKIE